MISGESLAVIIFGSGVLLLVLVCAHAWWGATKYENLVRVELFRMGSPAWSASIALDHYQAGQSVKDAAKAIHEAWVG